MNEEARRRDPDIQRVLSPCYGYWSREMVPPPERMICHSWAIDPYRERFGGTFHQAKLRRLANLGFLRQLYTVRGGSRRYHAIVNPERVAELLAESGLDAPGVAG